MAVVAMVTAISAEISLLVSVWASAGAFNAHVTAASAMRHGYANIGGPPSGRFAICGARKNSVGRRSSPRRSRLSWTTAAKKSGFGLPRQCPLCAKSGLMQRSKDGSLLDHLVGAGEQRLR